MGNEATGFRARIQKFGGVLSGMVNAEYRSVYHLGTDHGDVLKNRMVSK